MKLTTSPLSWIVGFLSLIAASTGFPQDYPVKPLRFIVPTTPGIGTDLPARILAPEMSKLLGQPIVVENKPGAGQMVAYLYVAKQAPADGYTFGMVSVSQLALLPVTVKDLRFDPLKDLPPFISVAEGRYVFVSPSTAPWKNFNELVSYAKANPGKLNYGYSAPSVRIAIEGLIRESGMTVVGVPYASGGAYLQALAGGEIHMGTMQEDNVATFGDRVRVLATTGDKRLDAMPAVPTFTELGYPRFIGFSYSLNVAAGTPKPIVDKLYSAASRALQQPEVRTQFSKFNLIILGLPPEVAAKRLADEASRYPPIAKMIGMQPE